MPYTGLTILFVLRSLFVNGHVSINDAGSFHGKVATAARWSVPAIHTQTGHR